MSEEKEGPDNEPPAKSVENLVNLGMELIKKTFNLNPEMSQQGPDQSPDQGMGMDGLQKGLTSMLQNAFKIGRPEPGGPGGAQPDQSQDQSLTSELTNGMKDFFKNLKPGSPSPQSPKSELDPASELSNSNPLQQMMQGLEKSLTSVASNFAQHGPSPSPSSSMGGASPHTPSPENLKTAGKALSMVPGPQAQAASKAAEGAATIQGVQEGMSKKGGKEGASPSPSPMHGLGPHGPEMPGAGAPKGKKSKIPGIPKLKPPGMPDQ